MMAMVQATMELVQARDHLMQVLTRIHATTELVQAEDHQRQLMARINTHRRVWGPGARLKQTMGAMIQHTTKLMLGAY